MALASPDADSTFFIKLDNQAIATTPINLDCLLSAFSDHKNDHKDSNKQR